MDKSLSWILRVSSAAGLVAIVISHSLSTYLGNANTRFSWLTSSQPPILLHDAEISDYFAVRANAIIRNVGRRERE